VRSTLRFRRNLRLHDQVADEQSQRTLSCRHLSLHNDHTADDELLYAAGPQRLRWLSDFACLQCDQFLVACQLAVFG
jgi:hypothetical protein